MAECSTTGGEGIDRFAATPEKLEDHFRPCLDTLAVELERHGVSDLSSARIYLGATAGMRLVSLMSEENSTRCQRLKKKLFSFFVTDAAENKLERLYVAGLFILVSYLWLRPPTVFTTLHFLRNL